MLHQVGVLFDLYYDAQKHKIKKTVRLVLFTELQLRGNAQNTGSAKKMYTHFKERKLYVV